MRIIVDFSNHNRFAALWAFDTSAGRRIRGLKAAAAFQARGRNRHCEYPHCWSRAAPGVVGNEGNLLASETRGDQAAGPMVENERGKPFSMKRPHSTAFVRHEQEISLSVEGLTYAD